MQAPVATADTFPHLADSLVRGVSATIPGGGKVAGVIVIVVIVLVNLMLVIAAVSGFRAVGGIKSYLSDFPSHNASTALALLLIFETGLVVLIRLALGLVFPGNYETWIWALIALAGVNVAGLGLKRFSDVDYVKEKAKGKAPPLVGPVAGEVTVNTTAEHKAAAQVPYEDAVG